MHNPTKATSMDNAYICSRLNKDATKTIQPIGINEQNRDAISTMPTLSTLAI